ncbi:zinc finger protein 646 isoform X2 [Xenopus laevis]|uniref:Zinc finger protein 646 isoform X2 n=1 Tax=Xenopus laevis TaxID=8355 RepID=A0A8J0U736_XENLA|nr:zinc finger protein 646 isoform X2 [Xenopus laevis]
MNERHFGSDQSDGASDNPINFSSMPELESPLQSPKEKRPYKCNQCDKTYRHAGSLVNHKKTHQIGLYSCLICQKEYSNPMGLKNHLRIHSEEKRFRCSECGECFRMARELSAHSKEAHAFNYGSNGENVPGSQESMGSGTPVVAENSSLISNIENYIAESMVPGDFSQLISKYYPDVNGEVECEESHNEQLETATELNDVQITDKSSEERRYTCKQCGKAYKHAGSLANHKQTHKVGVYQCGICFKEFSNPMAMKNHCRVHSDSRNSRLFKSPYSTSMLADHATLNNTALAKPQPAINNSRHVQEKCDEQLAMLDGSEGSMSEEETLKAPLDKLCSLQDSPPKRSSPSGKSNGQQTGIDTSIDIGLKDSCNHSTACDDMSAAALTRSFRPEDKASQSQSEQLGQEGTDEEEAKPGESLENRPFKCQACEKTYRHAGSLINHKKTHQTGVYSCSVCSKQLFNMAALKNHLRAHFKSRVGRRLGDSYFEPASFSDELFHSAEESHKCEVCNEILVSKKDFLQHQVFHQQECIKDACNDVAKAEVDTTMENCWGENLQSSQGSSAHSAYSSAPVILDVIKMEIENLSSQQPLEQSSHQGTIEMPGEGFRKESIGDGFKNTLACFEQSSEDQIISKETDFSGVEEHDPTSDDRPYKCEACGRTYRHKSSLLNHKLTHQTGVYKCSICPKQYSNLMALRNHLRFHSRRSSGKQSSTSLQSHQFPHHKLKEHQNMGSPTHVTSLQLSLNEEEAYTTPLNEADVASTEQTAEAVVETKEATEAHGNIPEAQEQQTGRKLYECNLCEKSYRHSGSLINHKRTHQTGDYVCSVCSKHVHNLAALKNHLRIHHNVKRRQGERSDISGVLFPDMYFSQGNQEMFICGNCDEMFQSEQDLLTHQEMHLQLGDSWDQGQDLGMMELNATSTEEKESSFMGFEGYNDWESLKVSESVKGTDQDPENEDLDSTEKENCYSCDECGEQFRSAVELTNHKHTHQTGIYQCSFCPKEYPDLLSLRNHFVSHTKLQVLRNGNQEASDGSEDRELVDSLPSYDNRYDCGHCGMIFSNEADFHQHQVAHENQVISSLPGNSVEDDQLREFSFPMHTSEQELLRSINNEMESGESGDVSDGGPHLSHICGFCGKTYDDLASLEVHSLSHADDVPPADNSHIGAEVDLVDTNMQANTDTKQEEEETNPVAHSKNDENQECRPYTCDKCGKSYRHGGSLVNHKKTHLVGNFKCFVCSRQYPNLAAFRNHLRHHPKCKKQASYSNIQELQAQSPSDGTHSGDNGEIVISSPASSVPLPDPYASQENANECSNPLYNNTSLQNHTSVHLPSQPHKTRYKSLSRHGGVRSARISGRRRRLVANRSLDDSVQNSSKKDSQNASEALDKPVQICPFCGKVFLFVDELLKHLSESCDSSKCNKETGSTNTVDQVDIKEKAPLSLCSVGQNRETEETSQQRPFRCEVCGRSYRHAGSLINHKQTHKTGIFRCAICQKPFFNLMAMKNHNRIHFELKRHKCLDCGKAFRLCKQLETHQRIHKEKASAKRPGRRNGRVVRPRRGSALQKRKSLCDDVPASNVSKDSSVKDKERRDRKSLGASAKRDPDARPYQCKECGRSYRHAGSLFNHKKSHTMGHYCCSICGKTYPNLMAMKNHQRTHYEAKRHACGECGKTFKWKRQLIRHQRVHIKEQIKQENGTSALESAALSTDLPGAIVAFTQEFEGSSSKAFTEATLQPNCTHCGKVFSYNDLENHVCIEISVTEGPVKVENCQNEVGRPPDSSQGHQAEERPYRCNLCGRTYRHAGSLLNHKNTHKTGLYKCSVCLKQFCNPMAMKNHCRTHTAEKRFQCLECGKAFRSSRELICHERVHTSERPFHCPICNCGFSSKLTLRHHQRSHSKLPSLSTRTVPSSQAVPAEGTKTCEEDPSGSAEVASNIDSSNGQEERRFKCNQCDRSYRHAGSLLNHRKTHSTGVYQCPDCHKEFFNLLALKNHLRIHRYPCPDCGKAFRIASHLATHLKIHEQGGPFTCQHCSKRFFCLSTFEQHQLTHNTQDTDVLEPPPMGNLKVEVT